MHQESAANPTTPGSDGHTSQTVPGPDEAPDAPSVPGSASSNIHEHDGHTFVIINNHITYIIDNSLRTVNSHSFNTTNESTSGSFNNYSSTTALNGSSSANGEQRGRRTKGESKHSKFRGSPSARHVIISFYSLYFPSHFILIPILHSLG